MRKILAVAVLAAALGTNTVARAEGSAEAGRGKSAVCAACHGPDGNSGNPEWPSLAGQHAGYIVAQLEAFAGGGRQNPLMSPIAAPLSEEDRQDLAAYYAAQTPALREADPENLERGRKLYVGGDPERGITACIACHGPTGQGNPLARYPAIAGQHASYTTATLEHYASGARSSDPNRIMRSIAARMSAEDIRAVSNYLQGLR